MSGRYSLIARKGPLWVWFLLLVWLVVEAVLLQAAVASGSEFEDRAATISWIIFYVLLAAGIAVYVVRRRRRS